MAKKSYSQEQKQELLDKLPDKPTYAQIRQVANAHGVNEITLLTWVKKHGGGLTPTKPISKRSTAKTYTHPTGLNAGDRVEVVDGAIEKDNGKVITVTRVGPIFVEGVDENKKPVAAYKVKRALDPQPISTPDPEPEIHTEPVPLRKPAVPAEDEIIWERKLVYDIQTSEHLYRVKVETKSIDIIDGEGNTIKVDRNRLKDIQLIFKNLPELLKEEK